jgi:hypothetical protein
MRHAKARKPPHRGRFLFYAKDECQPVDVETVLHGYGADVVNVLGEDAVVALVTDDILDRVRADNPDIAFEEDVLVRFFAARH